MSEQKEVTPELIREMLTNSNVANMISPEHAFGMSYANGNIYFNLGSYFYNAESAKLEISTVAHLKMGINEFASVYQWMGQQLADLEAKGFISHVEPVEPKNDQ